MRSRQSGGRAALLGTNPQQNGQAEARRLAVVAAQAADDKGGEDILVLEVADVLTVVDEFVIASASNERLVKAIVDEVERKVHEAGLAKPLRVEGRDERKWVLLDYGDVVVHVFLREVREYYELERLWSDVPRVDWAADLATASQAR